MKGWTVFDTGEGALENYVTLQWFTQFALNVEVSKYFDLDRSKGSFAGRYAIKVQTCYFTEETQSAGWRGKAFQLMKDYAAKCPPTTRNCYCVLEPSPFKRQQNIRLGRAKGLLSKHIPEQYSKVEWATATIYVKPSGKGSLLLRTWDQKKGWDARDSLLKDASNQELSADHFIREMDDM